MEYKQLRYRTHTVCKEIGFRFFKFKKWMFISPRDCDELVAGFRLIPGRRCGASVSSHEPKSHS